MSRVFRWFTLSAALLTVALLYGCGGSGPSAPAVGAGTGNLAVRVQFANLKTKASRAGASRQVPIGAAVIKVTLTDPATQANLAQPQIVAAPAPGQTATVQFSGIRAGPVHIAVAAYPDQNAVQPPLALGQADITISSGEATPVTITLLPTADHITVTGGAGSLGSGSSLTLTAQVFDSSNTSLTGYPLVWTSGNTNIATVMVDPTNPYSATVTGVAPGTVAIEVREPNSGITDLVTINVVAGATGLQAGPWPMFHANVKHTGQGSGSGATGVQKWAFKTGSSVQSSPVISTDGTIYVGSADGNVYALNGATGQQIWAFKTGNQVPSSPAIGANGDVYVGSFDDNVYALNGATGQQIWSFKTGGSIFSSPAIGMDGTVYVGSDDDNVYALNGATGQQKWAFKTGDFVQGSPAIGPDGTVYVSSNAGVYAVNGASGQEIWLFQIGNSFRSSPAIGADGTVYVGADDGVVFALNGATGVLVWSYNTGVVNGERVSSSPALGTDGTVYVGNELGGNVYALNGATGKPIWAFKTGNQVLSSPAIGSNGTIYVGSADGNLYALNGATGQQIWAFKAGGGVNSSPSIGADGVIYVGSDDNNVYAIQ